MSGLSYFGGDDIWLVAPASYIREYEEFLLKAGKDEDGNAYYRRSEYKETELVKRSSKYRDRRSSEESLRYNPPYTVDKKGNFKFYQHWSMKSMDRKRRVTWEWGSRVTDTKVTL